MMPPPWAVHLAEGTMTPHWCAAGWLAAALIVAASARKLADEEVPRLGVLTAVFFVGSQIHLPVLGVGSAHLLLNGVAAAVLGKRVGVAVAVGLALQALLFAHGGFTTLGVNVVVYTLPAWAGLSLVRGMNRFRNAPRGWLLAGGFAWGAAVAAGTVALNGLALHLGGDGVAKDAAGVVMLTNLPLIAVEGVAVAFVAVSLHRAVGSGNTSSNGTSH